MYVIFGMSLSDDIDLFAVCDKWSEVERLLLEHRETWKSYKIIQKELNTTEGENHVAFYEHSGHPDFEWRLIVSTPSKYIYYKIMEPFKDNPPEKE